MIRRLLTLLAAALVTSAAAAQAQAQTPAPLQTTLKASSGTARFFSKAPLEDIAAESRTLQAVIEPATGRIAVQVAIRSFDFPNELMEEHFNENYLESAKYPMARFAGAFAAPLDPAAPPAEVAVKGTLTLHGVSRPLEATVRFSRVGAELVASTQLWVALADYQIEVPRLLFRNIAERVEVTLEARFPLAPSK